MTVAEVKNQLITYLLENTYFNIPDDAVSIKFEPNLEEEHKNAVILLALEDLKSAGLLKCASSGLWVLTQPLESYSQQVEISATTAEAVSNFINAYRDANNVKGNLVNKLALKEQDIMNLLIIAHGLLSDEEEDDEQQ